VLLSKTCLLLSDEDGANFLLRAGEERVLAVSGEIRESKRSRRIERGKRDDHFDPGLEEGGSSQQVARGKKGKEKNFIRRQGEKGERKDSLDEGGREGLLCPRK